MTQDSPCTAVCKIDPATRLCSGCGRTLDEIGAWSQMNSAERRAVMTQLSARMKAAGLRKIAPATPR